MEELFFYMKFIIEKGKNMTPLSFSLILQSFKLRNELIDNQNVFMKCLEEFIEYVSNRV